MAKKPKQPHNNANTNTNNGDSNSGSRSGSTDVFKTLFGDIPEQGTSISLFSNDNPFRRKSTDGSQTVHQPEHQHQSGLGFNSAMDIESPQKRKRNREIKENLDAESNCVVSETPSETKKKSKRVETENPISDSSSKKLLNKGKEEEGNLDSEEMLDTEDREKTNLGSQSEELSNGKANSDMETRKKKRKRDEVEAEYEARQYGVAVKEGGREERKLGGGELEGVVGAKRKKMDNPEDTMVPKEGFDDESKLLRTVFVGNLPLKVKKKALLKEFSQFGEVESVRIRSIPILDIKVPRKGAIITKQTNDSADSVHAYIVFKTEESSQASLANNMAVLGGNHIRVDRACPPRKKMKGDNAPLYDNKRTVFVGNLPFDVKDEEIYQLFCGINNLECSIEAIRVIRDSNTSMGKGIAYVLFKTRDAANLVVKKRNLKLRDRELRLTHARSNSTPSRRKISSSAETNDTRSKRWARASKTPDSYNKVQTKDAISYQGLRANKSGVQKKVHRLKTVAPVKPKSKKQKPKEGSGKRPAVARRKANALKIGGASRQPEKKRKLENQTPDSARRSKKPRKF